MIESKTMKKELTNIKAILFDMGNVLIFFDAKRSSKAFSEAVGVPEDKIWKTFFVSTDSRLFEERIL